MSEVVELRFDGQCTVAFVIDGRKGDYVGFGIEFRFQGLDAAIPSVRGCSMSTADIERLIEYVNGFLQDAPRELCGAFAAYDAFFTLEALEDDALRLMASFGPDHPFSLGIEGTVTVPGGIAFRDGWASQLRAR